MNKQQYKMLCEICCRAVQLGDQLGCIACKKMYHYSCLNLTSAWYRENKAKIRTSWKCTSCSNVTSRAHRPLNSDDTPVRGVALRDVDMSICDEPSPDLDAKSTVSFDAMYVKLESLLSTKLDNFAKELHESVKNLKVEFTKTTDFLGEQIKDLDGVVRAVSDRVLHLEQENERLRSELGAVTRAGEESDSGGLRDVIDQLRSDLNDREQASLLNDVEITGVPEFEAESCGTIVTSLAFKIGVSLELRDVVSVSRVGPPRTKPLVGETLPRPRPIVVTLSRRSLRDDIIRCARVRREGITTSDLGLPQHDPKRVYFNERLTKTNRKLFGMAREAGRAHRWKYVWTREGRVNVRRDDKSVAHRICSEKDIKRVFDN